MAQQSFDVITAIGGQTGLNLPPGYIVESSTLLADGDLFVLAASSASAGATLVAQLYNSADQAIGGLLTVGHQGLAQNPNGWPLSNVAALSNGDVVVGWSDGTGGATGAIRYAVYDPSAHLVLSGTVLPVAATAAVEVAALGDGGFAVAWSQKAESGSGTNDRLQTFDAAGHATSDILPMSFNNGTHPVAHAGPAAGGWVESTGVQLRYFDGATLQPTINAAHPVQFITTLADGRVGLMGQTGNNGTLTTWVGIFDPATNAITWDGSQTVPWSGGSIQSIAATADGGFVVEWNTPGASSGKAFSVGADGSVSALFVMSGDLAEGAAPSTHLATIGWANSNGSFVQNYTTNGAAADEHLQTFGAAVALADASAWTSATVLSTHVLALVAPQDGGYGSHVGVEHTYDAAGAETSTTSLMGYAGAGQRLTPHIAALADGFFTATYAGSSDSDTYNASGQRVLVHNAYTSPTAEVTPLSNGGYVQTDSASSQFALFDANANAVGWFALPADAPAAPSGVLGLGGGGFLFTYAGSAHFDLYGGSGQQLVSGNLGASASEFATGVAALPGASPGFAEAWLSDSGGQNGQPTTIELQLFGPAGEITQALPVAQDLDPWHTQFALQAHDDNSVALLWSQGGAAWGAEYANGAVGAVHSTGVAEALSDMRVIELTGDKVGLAYAQDGHAWAEIFDPSSGDVQRADLGTAVGDVSTLHALATANGGMAVSWHNAAGIGNVVGAVLDASGQIGFTTSLPGDLLGVDVNGHAVSLYNSGPSAYLQAVTVNDTLFWVH